MSAGRVSPRPTGGLARRVWLGGALAAVAAGTGVLAGCAAGAPRASGSGPVAQAVAPGLWMLPGARGEPDAANRARTGNAALWVGPRGALMVDAGVSWRQGRDLLEAARRLAAPQPLRLLLLTHVRQDFVLGAAAFQEAGVPVWMHPAAARLMRSRCEGCLRALQRLLGPEEMQGTRVVQPDGLVEPGDARLAEAIGRPLQLLAWGREGHSSGPGDLALFDPDSGSLVAGGLLDADQVPDVQDADFAGWRSALAALRSLPIRRILPGHGPLADAGLVDRVAAYLDALEARTAELLAQGVPLSEVADACELPAFAHWDQYDSIHRRNASVVYLRHEREWLRRAAPPNPS